MARPRWSLCAVGRVAGGLQGGVELAEVAGPEVGQELLYRGKTAGVNQEQVTRALAALLYQAGFVHHLQVLGHRLRGDVEVASDVSDRPGVVRDQLQDGPAVRFGERLESRVGVHG